MKGGYFMIDFKGVSLNNPFTLTSLALYKRCVQAIASKKAVFLHNIAFVASNICTPIPAYVAQSGNVNNIYVYFTGYRMIVTNTGSVTLEQLGS